MLMTFIEQSGSIPISGRKCDVIFLLFYRKCAKIAKNNQNMDALHIFIVETTLKEENSNAIHKCLIACTVTLYIHSQAFAYWIYPLQLLWQEYLK